MPLSLSFVYLRHTRRRHSTIRDLSSSTPVDRAEAGSIQWWTMQTCSVHILGMRLTLLALIQGVRVNLLHVAMSLSINLSGVSRSTPSVSFFDNNVDREIWTAGSSVFSVVNTSTNSLGELVADAQVVGQLAGATNHNGYLNSINTDYTARDMLRITKAYGWDKIQYWGIS